MINWGKFNLAFQYYEKELVIEIIDLFINGEAGEDNGYEARLNILDKAIKQKDYITINLTAHSLKGVIANFYDPVAVELATKLMIMGDEKTDYEMPETFEKLKIATQYLVMELHEYRRQNLPDA